MLAPADIEREKVQSSETSAPSNAHRARKTVRAALWAALDAISQTFVSTLVFLLVARILGPRDFGVAALSFGIVQIFNLCVETLLQDALVQREGLTELQIHSAFWWSVVSGAVIAAALMLAAPIFAHFLGAPLITPLLRVMSAGLIFTGAGAVPIALMRRSLSFRLLMICSVTTRFVTGISSAALAIYGAGAFALVAQTTVAPVMMTTLALGVSGWRPAKQFSWAALKTLLIFGVHVVGNQMIWLGGMRLYIVCIGMLFGPAAVGFYNIAQRVIDTARDTLGLAVSNLALSAFSRDQNDRERLSSALSRGTEIIALTILPVFAIIGGSAHPLVHLLLTQKWIEAVPIIQLFAASAMLYFFRCLQTPAISATGRPDINLMLTSVSTIVSFIFLLIFGRWSLFLASAGWGFLRPVILIPISVIIIKRNLGMTVRSQMFSGGRVALAAVAAGGAAYLISNEVLMHQSPSATTDCTAILLSAIAGLMVHLGGVALFSRGTLNLAVHMFRLGVHRAA